jgi:Asp-tRNA(Asn)/Glu-tRNA(Gln) amidotransferase A subunit family amidase
VVRDCLARIEAREPQVEAWAYLDPELALTQARALDRAPSRGPLHGVPIGVKDIFDTADMPTEMGSPIYRDNRTRNDAACVAWLRAAGAVILGKTVTCEFASPTPSRTKNPHNAGHTPGGSSSGSGAAVADWHVPAALGTQTGGSVLRPAAYCGVFGFKPTYGTFSRQGVKPAAETVDTVGLIARSLDDMDLLTAVLRMQTPAPSVTLDRAPRIGFCRTPIWHLAEPATVQALESAAASLTKAGATVREVRLPPAFDGVPEAARGVINQYERAISMAWEWNNHRDQIGKPLAASIIAGAAVPLADYVAALQVVETARARLPDVFDGLDVLLAPCVCGEAPAGLEFAGDGSLQAFWTALHTPTITLPTHRGPNNLPVGIQFVAPRYADAELLAAARWIWNRIGSPDMIGVR